MSYKIPLFDVTIGEDEIEAVKNTLESRWISMGDKTAEFEQKFSSMLGCKHSVALTNCTVALHLALKSLGIKNGDEVITPSLTFVATVNAIMYCNAVPIFCDVTNYEDLTIDPYQIEQLITDKTKAIIVMHYGGFSCNMKKILEIADKYHLYVIEDACHGPLSEYENQKLGTIGDVGCFSFYSNKNISIGEGGMLVTNNDEIFAKSKLLRSHGMTSLSYDRYKGHSTSYDVTAIGYNYRIDDIRSSMGIVQLNKLRKDLLIRQKKRERYITYLRDIKNIIIPFKEYEEFSSNYIFPIIIMDSNYNEREEIRRLLGERGIQTSVHYPSVHKFNVYEEYFRRLPCTEYVSDCEISLPMYSKLEDNDICFICESLDDVLNIIKN